MRTIAITDTTTTLLLLLVLLLFSSPIQDILLIDTITSYGTTTTTTTNTEGRDEACTIAKQWACSGFIMHVFGRKVKFRDGRLFYRFVNEGPPLPPSPPTSTDSELGTGFFDRGSSSSSRSSGVVVVVVEKWSC